MRAVRHASAGRVVYLAAFAASMLGAALALPYLGLHLAPAGATAGHAYAIGIGLSAAAGLAANPVAARLARRTDPMSTFAGGVLLQGAGLAIVAAMHASLPGVLVGFAINGLGSGAAFGTATAALVDRFGRGLLPGILAAQGLLTNLATGVAGAAASVAVAAAGPAAYGLFLWAAVAGYGLLAAVLGVMAAKASADRAPVDARTRTRHDPFAGFRDARFRWVLAVQLLVAGLVTAQLNRVYPLAWTAGGLDPALVGVLFAINAAGVVALQLPALRLARTVGPRRMLMTASGAMLASVTTVALAIDGAPFVAAAIGVVLVSVAEVCITASLQPLIVAASPPGGVVEHAANASLVFSIALIVATPVGVGILSIAPWLYWAASIVAALLLVALTARLRVDERESDG